MLIVYLPPLPSWMFIDDEWSRSNGAFVPTFPPYDVPPYATPTASGTGSAAVSSDAAKNDE